MDSGQFEALVSRLSPYLTRRSSLGVLGVLGVAGASLAPEAEGRKKKKKGNKKKRKCTPASLTCPSGQKACDGACIVADRCCADGECPPGRACVHGVCDCAPNTTPCLELCCINSSQICQKEINGAGVVVARCLDQF